MQTNLAEDFYYPFNCIHCKKLVFFYQNKKEKKQYIFNPLEYNETPKIHACAKMQDQRLWQSRIVQFIKDAQDVTTLLECRWRYQAKEKIIKNLSILLPDEVKNNFYSFVDMQGHKFEVRLKEEQDKKIGGLYDFRELTKIGNKKYKISQLFEYKTDFEFDESKSLQHHFQISIQGKDYEIIEQAVIRIVRHLKQLECKVYQTIPIKNVFENKFILYKRRIQFISQDIIDNKFLNIDLPYPISIKINEV